MSSQPPTTYTVSPSLTRYTSPPSTFLAANPSIDHLIAGAVVTDPRGRILLLRRAAHDSWPNKWEVPGGCVDPEDSSLVAAAVRELWEESGLVTTHVRAAVGLYRFSCSASSSTPSTSSNSSTSSPGNRGQDAAEHPKGAGEDILAVQDEMVLFRETGNTWGKLTAWTDVASCEAVTVRPDEHADWAWVTREEAEERRFAHGGELDFVSDGVRLTVLEGFRLWKESRQ